MTTVDASWIEQHHARLTALAAKYGYFQEGAAETQTIAQFIAAIADGSLVVIAPATTWTDTVTALDRAVLGLPLTPRDRHALVTIARNIMSSTSCYAD